MKKFLFADLDDTLFQTAHKCGPELEAQLEPIAYYQDGSICSYTTAAQRAFLSMVSREMVLIPTTARDLDALRRVDLPRNSYAIANFGGVIVKPDGELDLEWMQHMQQALAPAQALFPTLLEMLENYLGQQAWGARARIVQDAGLHFYALVKETERSAPHLAAMEEQLLRPWLATQGQLFYLHRNANNLAILPKALNKTYAVRQVQHYLRQAYGAILSIGMGDSHSDASFLAACDYAMMPSQSQLAKTALEPA